MNNWQPIETAPKDGTEIRARIPGYGDGNIISWQMGFVNAKEEECGGWVFRDGEIAPPCWTDGACWEVNEDGVQSEQPTHWMPLK